MDRRVTALRAAWSNVPLGSPLTLRSSRRELLSCQVLRKQYWAREFMRLSTWPAKGRAAERTR
jgi:hypothetical protein